MNFYDFINSQAISSYCQEMGHEFMPIQAAYLVNSSHRHTPLCSMLIMCSWGKRI